MNNILFGYIALLCLSGGWVGGWVAGSIEIITNSAQLGLELGLSLANIKESLTNFDFPPNKA